MKGSIIPRGPRTWQLRWSTTTPAGTRKQHSRTVHGSKNDAKAALRATLEALERAPAASAQTVAEFLRAWLTAGDARGLAHNTLLNRRNVIEKRTIPHIGALRLVDLRPRHLQDLLTGWLNSGLQPRTARNYFGVLRAAFARAVALDELARNPTEGVELPRSARPEVPEVAIAETLKLIEAPCEHRLRLAVLLAAHAGLRAGEACGLRWSDIDLPAGILRVSAQIVRCAGGGYELRAPKSRASLAAVPLTVSLVGALTAHLDRQRLEKAMLGRRYQDSGFVLAAPDGVPWNPNALTVAFWRLAQRVGSPLHYHALRHSCGSHALAEGVDLAAVSRLLRHASPHLTASTYLHPVGELRGAEELERAYRRARDGNGSPGR